jgi:hypothetical protein
MNITEHEMKEIYINEVERLDCIRHDHILQADKGCRKLKLGNVAWSPKLQGSTSIELVITGNVEEGSVITR